MTAQMVSTAVIVAFVCVPVLAEEPSPSAKGNTAKNLTAEADPVIGESKETIEIPAGRPAWIGAEPRTSGKIHTIAVSSGPYKKERDSRRALDQAIEKATDEYIADQLGSDVAPTLLHYDAQAIKHCYLKDENKYHDQARYPEPVGLMHENFALLEFSPAFRDELHDRWMQVRATSRLTQTGLFSAAVLLLVASVFGYFRFDNATRGYYSSRLQFMTAGAVVAIVAASIVAVRWITWL